MVASGAVLAEDAVSPISRNLVKVATEESALVTVRASTSGISVVLDVGAGLDAEVVDVELAEYNGTA